MAYCLLLNMAASPQAGRKKISKQGRIHEMIPESQRIHGHDLLEEFDHVTNLKKFGYFSTGAEINHVPSMNEKQCVKYIDIQHDMGGDHDEAVFICKRG